MTHQSHILLLAVAISVGAMFAPHRGHAGKIRAAANKHTIPTWKWSKKATKLSWYVARYKGKHRISAPTSAKLFRKGVVQVKKRGSTRLRFRAHSETAFVIIGDRVIVYSSHGPISTGCVLIAYDLKKRRRLWKVRLKGVGPVGHSQYRNRINLRAGPGSAVTVFGWESHGKYIEVVDLKNGKTLTHRKVP